MLSGNNADERLIGIITKVTKKLIDIDGDNKENEQNMLFSENIAVISLVGTFYEIYQGQRNQFKRAINTYPEINSEVYFANQNALSISMNSLSSSNNGAEDLKIGRFASNKEVPAILDGNRFFQRHAAIVGSTGSGKSYTVANILERINKLPHGNAIVFDLHGEYNKLSYASQIKISSEDSGIHIPLWLFNYNEIHSLFIESSEGTSVNQRATVIEFILKSKKEYMTDKMPDYSTDVITADTPIPFSVKALISYLNEKNTEEINTGEVYKTGENKGQAKTKQGANYGKLTNLINRLQTKLDDKKYSFVFSDDNYQDVSHHHYLRFDQFTENIIINRIFKTVILNLIKRTAKSKMEL